MVFAVALTASAASQLPVRNSFKHHLTKENVLLKGDIGSVKQPVAHVAANATTAPNIITEQPEGELKKYVRSGDCLYSGYGFGIAKQSGKTNVVFGEDGLVYIQNPLWWLSENDTWVYGTYDESTGIISVPTGQYLSWRDDWGFGLKLAWGHTCIEEDENEVTNLDVYGVIDRDVTTILFQVEGDKISLLGSEGDLTVEDEIQQLLCKGICGDWSDEDNDYIDEAIEFNTVFRQISSAPAVPADPTAIDWYDCGNESGFSYFAYTLPTEDVDGNALDPELLSYSIYTDNDNLFTFEANSYSYDNLTEDLTEIPFSLYNDAVDFHPDLTYFYYTNQGDNPLFTNRIGIQAIYTADDGIRGLIRNTSNIVYYYPNVTSVDCVKASLDFNAPIYNIMGQRMRGSNLPAGVYIQNGKKFIVR